MQNLLLISIGPVQDFIATARRTRDLWFGSYLLSEIAKAVALELYKSDNNSLIFPAINSFKDLEPNQTNGLNVANKIMATVDKNEKSTKELAEKAKDAAIQRLKEFYNEASSKKRIKGDFDRNLAEQQVEDMLEFFWVSVPIAQEKDYPEVRQRAEMLLNARKSTRNFAAVTWGKNTPKSSLDGQREALIPPPELDLDKITSEDLYKQYRVKRGERLCGVGLLKRHGARGQDDRFFSTSHVAALPFLTKLDSLPDKEKTKAALKEYLSSLEASRFDTSELVDVPGEKTFEVFGKHDGHILFPERLGDYIESKEDIKNAQISLQHFYKELGFKDKPLPYYVLLLADGDRMGKAIDAQTTVEGHRNLSQDLANFANGVREIVTKHQGWLVYSGGDDVLAFLPLHQALDCANALQENFKVGLSKYSVKDNGDILQPTLSVGLAVAHHLEPLADTLELARSAEKEAKKERNSLAVSVDKRGGAVMTVSGSWENSNNTTSDTLYKRLKKFIDWHRTDNVPDGAAYELVNLIDRLNFHSCEQLKTDDSKIHTTMLNLEAMRIWKRKRKKGGTEEMSDNDLKYLGNILEDSKVSLEQLANELIISRLFASAASLAGTLIEVNND